MAADSPALVAVKLRSFARSVLAARDEDPSAVPPPTGENELGLVVEGQAFLLASALTAPGATGSGPDPVRSLGPALHWAAGRGATAVHLVADGEVADDLARRAGPFRDRSATGISVWRATGSEVVPASPRPAQAPPPLPEGHRALGGLITETGARAVDDHGMMVAEVAGLEVARVVDGDDGPRLDVGVGQADRELQQYIHGHLDDGANLQRAIGAVTRHRRRGSGSHPLARMARQRWLRSTLLDRPELIDAPPLEPVIPLRPRSTVLGSEPSVAAGPGVVVACSVGVDLDLIPEAADYRSRVDPGAALILVVPERDRRLVASALLDALDRAGVVSIEEPWAPAHPR